MHIYIYKSVHNCVTCLYFFFFLFFSLYICSHWDNNCLAKFTKFLGFSTERFKGEILNLLLRMKNRSEQRKKGGYSTFTRFKSELKKLECLINYNGVSRESGLDGGGARVSSLK